MTHKPLRRGKLGGLLSQNTRLCHTLPVNKEVGQVRQPNGNSAVGASGWLVFCCFSLDSQKKLFRLPRPPCVFTSEDMFTHVTSKWNDCGIMIRYSLAA